MYFYNLQGIVPRASSLCRETQEKSVAAERQVDAAALVFIRSEALEPDSRVALDGSRRRSADALKPSLRQAARPPSAAAAGGDADVTITVHDWEGQGFCARSRFSHAV
jgi:hypothetical protein